MELVEGRTGTTKDGRRVIVKGGKIVPMDGGGPKPRPDWGDGARELPDGSIVRYGPRGGTTVLQGPTKSSAAPPDIKDFQANAAARATLMDQGFSDYNAAVKEGYDPGDPRNVIARMAEGFPIVGPFAADVIRDNPGEKARAAELQFVDGALRTTSGANAPEPEVVRANRAYFRQPGEGEQVDIGKGQLRTRFRDQAVRIAGPAYIAPGAPSAPEQPRAPIQSRIAPTGLTEQQKRAAGRYKGTKADSGTERNPSIPVSEEQYNALPPGTWYIHRSGVVTQKKK